MSEHVLMVEQPKALGSSSRRCVTFVLALFAATLISIFMLIVCWRSVFDNALIYSSLDDEPDWRLKENNFYAEEINHQTARFKSRYIEQSKTDSRNLRVVCYYTTPDPNDPFNSLRLVDVNASLCSHINIGVAEIRNCTLYLSTALSKVLQDDVPVLRAQNPELKLLLWVGGEGYSSIGFPEMVKNHNRRKVFLKSMKKVLHQYSLDGIDLDWEFPSAYNKERQHFSQLMYEIKQEYQREKKDYLLSVAVAAVEGIAFFAYDVRELNKYADHINVMTYDYHFYSHGTPFTGLNAPLYARDNEHSILGTLNINYSVNWWLSNGLDRDKLVVGLPTYGHSFTLVNPFNNGIGAPAEGFGHCGDSGFTTYSEVCWFNTHNLHVSISYDEKSCSPFLSSGTEWISYENVKSLDCKARFITSNNLGGAMIFSVNTDDIKNSCQPTISKASNRVPHATFPLTETVKKVFGEAITGRNSDIY